MNKIKSLISKFSKSTERTKDIVRNAALSIGMKGASVLSTLLLIPLTIHYLTPTKYGIWLTLSSVIGWVTLFDLGLGNGFRNKFAEAKAKGDTLLCRRLLSTTYFAISNVVGIVLLIALIINYFIDWTEVLKVSPTYHDELRSVFAIVCTFACLNMVVSVINSFLSADQKNGYSSVIAGIGQYISLLVVFILTKTTTGSLYKLAVYYAGVPFIVTLIASLLLFNFSHYKIYSPSIRFIRRSLIKNILQLGGQFFIIYLCLIAIFQVVNIVISREVGSTAVTQYQIANRYFGILYQVLSIIVAPFWSAFTDAYTQKDFAWMKSMVKRLEQLWIISCIVGLVMLLISPIFYHIWIGDSVKMDFSISVAMFLLINSQSLGLFMTLINGIGTIRIQLITYIFLAVIAWPMFTYVGRSFGLIGIIAIPSIAWFIQGFLALIQVKKILNETAQGLWMK